MRITIFSRAFALFVACHDAKDCADEVLCFQHDSDNSNVRPDVHVFNVRMPACVVPHLKVSADLIYR